jgi:hypothetical protein
MFNFEKLRHSLRRHNTAKKKARIKKFIKETWFRGKELAEDDAFVGKMAANHGASCSCAACGNPRRYHNELTKQELIQLELFPDMIAEATQKEVDEESN